LKFGRHDCRNIANYRFQATVASRRIPLDKVWDGFWHESARVVGDDCAGVKGKGLTDMVSPILLRIPALSYCTQFHPGFLEGSSLND